MPLMQTFIQVVPPVWLPLLPVEVLVIVDVEEVVLCPSRPQAGCYQVVQRGYVLLVDHESFQLCSVIVENLAVNLVS